jgi:hypothetical protein
MRIDSKKCSFEDGTASNMCIISVGIISGLDGAINGPLGPSYHHRMTILENIRTAYIYGRHPYLCSKLNNTESKLTGVPPHFFVIVIVIITMCVCFVVVLAHIY